MEFIPQFFSNSRTVMVVGLMVWGLVTYAISQRLKCALVERERA